MAAGLLPMAAPVCPVICGFSTPYPRHFGAHERLSPVMPGLVPGIHVFSYDF